MGVNLTPEQRETLRTIADRLIDHAYMLRKRYESPLVAGTFEEDAAALRAMAEEKEEGNCHDGTAEEDHDWKFVSDWYGDPDVINGTADCSHWVCRVCGKEDYEREPPEPWDGEIE